MYKKYKKRRNKSVYLLKTVIMSLDLIRNSVHGLISLLCYTRDMVLLQMTAASLLGRQCNI